MKLLVVLVVALVSILLFSVSESAAKMSKTNPAKYAACKDYCHAIVNNNISKCWKDPSWQRNGYATCVAKVAEMPMQYSRCNESCESHGHHFYSTSDNQVVVPTSTKICRYSCKKDRMKCFKNNCKSIFKQAGMRTCVQSCTKTFEQCKSACIDQ